jgi:hypothetical protein
MNPIDSTVESLEADGCRGRQRRRHLRPAFVKPFDVWLKAQDAFAITFDRFCSDADRPIASAATS